VNPAEERPDRSRESRDSPPGASEGTRDRLVVTIDGPAGTGKSSVARRVAERLGLFVLDTGAMYRAVAWLANRDSIEPSDQDRVVDALDAHPVRPHPDGDRTLVTVGDIDPGESLRSLDVESIVSIIAALPRVRERLVEAQRDFANRHPRLVTEGRDQGSVVFPDATARFFLTASPEVRARRRLKQIIERGGNADLAVIRNGIESRDLLDASRSDGPLVKPQGAVEIETDTLELETVVARIVTVVRDSADLVSRPDSEALDC